MLQDDWGLLRASLNEPNIAESYFSALARLLRWEGEDREVALQYAEQHLETWEERYRTPLQELLPKLQGIDEILHNPPHHLAFRAIVAELVKWQGAGREQAIEFARGRLAHWSSSVRTAPWPWVAGLAEEDPDFRWQWVSALPRVHPVFTHFCYRPPEGLVTLPSEAGERLQRLSHIPDVTHGERWENAAEPGVLCLERHMNKKQFSALLNSPENRDIVHLLLQNPAGYQPGQAKHTIETLVETGHLARLQTLRLYGFSDSMKLKTMTLLAETPTPHLHTLDLSFSVEYQRERRFLEQICQGDFPNLKRLSLVGFHLQDEDMQLFEHSKLQGLEMLELGYNGLSDRGIELLARAPFAKLRVLELSSNQVGPAGLQCLAQAPCFSSLWALHLSNNPLGDLNEAVRTVANSAHFRELIELILSQDYEDQAHYYSTDIAEAMASSAAFSRLDHLSIGHIDLTNACDGHGPEPMLFFAENGMDILRNSPSLRPEVKWDLALLQTSSQAALDGYDE